MLQWQRPCTYKCRSPFSRGHHSRAAQWQLDMLKCEEVLEGTTQTLVWNQRKMLASKTNNNCPLEIAILMVAPQISNSLATMSFWKEPRGQLQSFDCELVFFEPLFWASSWGIWDICPLLLAQEVVQMMEGIGSFISVSAIAFTLEAPNGPSGGKMYNKSPMSAGNLTNKWNNKMQGKKQLDLLRYYSVCHK